MMTLAHEWPITVIFRVGWRLVFPVCNGWHGVNDTISGAWQAIRIMCRITPISYHLHGAALYYDCVLRNTTCLYTVRRLASHYDCIFRKCKSENWVECEV